MFMPKLWRVWVRVWLSIIVEIYMLSSMFTRSTITLDFSCLLASESYSISGFVTWEL